MRLFVLLLILGNLALFAWGQGYIGRQDDGREPERMSRQLQPDKLLLSGWPPPPAVVDAAGAPPFADSEAPAVASPPATGAALPTR